VFVFATYFMQPKKDRWGENDSSMKNCGWIAIVVLLGLGFLFLGMWAKSDPETDFWNGCGQLPQFSSDQAAIWVL
jgi:hypothetical protein